MQTETGGGLRKKMADLDDPHWRRQWVCLSKCSIDLETGLRTGAGYLAMVLVLSLVGLLGETNGREVDRSGMLASTVP
jgi:hypothetical protein